ncbi:kinase-like protein [Atractiella rhizophila]|nr:kinase-like protein [Atractiella rhizophila]
MASSSAFLSPSSKSSFEASPSDRSASPGGEEVSLLYDPRGLSLRPRRSSSIRTKASTGSFGASTSLPGTFGSAIKERDTFRNDVFRNIREEERDERSQSPARFQSPTRPHRPGSLHLAVPTSASSPSTKGDDALYESPITGDSDVPPWSSAAAPLPMSPTRHRSPSPLSYPSPHIHSAPPSGILHQGVFSNSQRLVNPSHSTSRSGARKPYHVLSPTASTMSITSSSTSISSSSYGQIPWTPAVQFLAGMAESTYSTQSADGEGEKVDGYVLGKTIGWGGFSIVKEGKKDDEVVAVKIVRHEDGMGLDGLGGSGGLESVGVKVDPPTPVIIDRRLQKVFRGLSVGSGGYGRDRSCSSPGLLPSAIPEEKPLVVNLSSSLHGIASTDATPKREHEHAEKIRRFLEREIKIWSKLDHPHIVPLLHLHSSPEATYIFMPLCKGGNLLHYINELGRRGRSLASRSTGLALSHSSTMPVQPLPDRRKEGGTWERGQANGHGLDLRHVKHIFAQVVDGLRYLHLEEKVVHKDIKLENILMDENGRFRIADFGLAEVVSYGGSWTRRRDWGGGHGVGATDSTGVKSRSERTIGDDALPGSLAYSPPEQVRSRIPIIDFSVDMWALGCVLYALIEGRLPFEDPFEPRLKMKILKGDWELPSSLQAGTGPGKKMISFFGVSSEEDREKRLAEEMLRGLLDTDPSRRWDIVRVSGSEWMRGAMEKQRKSRKDYIEKNTNVEFSDDEMDSDLDQDISPSPVDTFRNRRSRSASRSRSPQVGRDRSSSSPKVRRERSSSRQGRLGREAMGNVVSMAERSLSRGAEKALRLVGLKSSGVIEGERTPRAEKSRSTSSSRGRRSSLR